MIGNVLKVFVASLVVSLWAYSENTITIWIRPEEAVAAGAAWRLSKGIWHETGERAVVASTQLLNFREVEGWRTPTSWLVKETQQSSTVVVWYAREISSLDSLAFQMEVLLDGTSSGKVMLAARDGASRGYIANEDVQVTEGGSLCTLDGEGRAMEWDTQPLDNVIEWCLTVQNPLAKELSLAWESFRIPVGSRIFLLEENGEVLQELAGDGVLSLGKIDGTCLCIQVNLPNVQDNTLELYPGWNAVSLVLEPAPVTLARLLSCKPMVYSALTSCYVFAKSLSAYQPFWIFARERGSLPLIGYSPSRRPEQMEVDWVFLAVEEETEVPESMVAFEWDGAHYGQVKLMRPGHAYWLISGELNGATFVEDNGNGAQ